MKKIFLTTAIFFISLSLFSQFFNSAKILKPGHFSIGFNPIDFEKSLALFMYGGFGVTNKVDISLRYGFFDGADYLGGDIEWALRNTGTYDISLITGAHDFGDFGLDLGVIVSIFLIKHANILTGLDCDINFDKNNTRNFWLPVGVELSWKENASITIEADIPVSEWAPHIFGGGVTIYLP